MATLTSVLWVILWVYVFGKVAEFIRIPHIVALILVGLFFNVPSVHDLFLTGPQINGLIAELGDIALIALMLLAGLETSMKELRHESKDAMTISLLAAFTPFLLGFLIFYAIGYDIATSLVVAVAMCITAEATTAALLLELKKIKTRVGTLMMESGIIDDVLGLSLFIGISFFLREVDFKENLLLGTAIAAFFGGIFLQGRFHRAHVSIVALKRWMFLLLIPFFFVSMGSHFDLHSLLVSPGLAITIVLIAFFGKLVGTLMAKPFLKITWKKLYLVGWAMNSRGAIELALALVAFRTGLITVDIYSSLVIMALTTTLAFPFVITHMVKQDPKIMN